MASTIASDARSMNILRWLARSWAMLSIAFVLLFFIGEGFPVSVDGLSAITPREWLLLVCFPVGTVTGLLLAWRWEIAGGLIVVISFVAFYLIDYLWTSSLPRGPWFAIVAAPGLLFLLHGFLTRRRPLP